MSEYPLFAENGDVICQLCGKGVKQLGSFHLTKLHNMTLTEYRDKYPDHPLAARKGIPIPRKEVIEDPGGLSTTPKGEPIIETMDEITDEEIQTHIEELKKITIENGQIQSVKINSSTGNEIPGKDKIVSYLKSVFYEVVSNHFIEKINIYSGILEYRFVTDISIPSRKIDFEFPNAFWHNNDQLNIVNRNRYLQADGWTIVIIPGKNPSVVDVEAAVKKLFSSEQ